MTISGNVTVSGVPATAADRGAGAATANTLRVVLVNEQVEGGEYEDVAAGQTAVILGSAGATGDFLSGVIVFPESLNPGAITLQDGSLTAVNIFWGGTASVSNLVPFWIPFGHASINGPLKITTGTAVHIRAVGNFS
jgi:hypothetical protein